MDEFLYLWAQWGLLSKQDLERILEEFGDLRSAWLQLSPAFLREKLHWGRDKMERLMSIRFQTDLKPLYDLMARLKIRLVFIGDSDYPSLLKEIHDPPVFLWVRGSLPSFEKPLGVVGTRKMTDYGRLVTQKITSDLVGMGCTIISGLALGVDAVAHEQSVLRAFPTVAVLGCGVDRLYPAANGPLASRILETGGAILSEYIPGTPALSHHFPARNRIIAGLSQGILVTEAGVKSGALITAKMALEENREVFAVPSDIRKPELGGTNWLIKNTRAHLVESAEDIVERMGYAPLNRADRFSNSLNALDSELSRHLAQCLLSGPQTFDTLQQKTGEETSPVLIALADLQLRGLIEESGSGWALKIH